MGIKDVLKEELANSLQMAKAYSRELAKLPPGSLVRKKINGRPFYYLVYRQGAKVKTRYMGRLSRAEVKQEKEKSEKRRRIKARLSQVKKQVRYLRTVLRGRYAV
jgi:hypothetical protein